MQSRVFHLKVGTKYCIKTYSYAEWFEKQVFFCVSTMQKKKKINALCSLLYKYSATGAQFKPSTTSLYHFTAKCGLPILLHLWHPFLLYLSLFLLSSTPFPHSRTLSLLFLQCPSSVLSVSLSFSLSLCLIGFRRGFLVCSHQAIMSMRVTVYLKEGKWK